MTRSRQKVKSGIYLEEEILNILIYEISQQTKQGQLFIYENDIARKKQNTINRNEKAHSSPTFRSRGILCISSMNIRSITGEI